MNLANFLLRVQQGDAIDFQETLSIIDQYYRYQPTEFSNGLVQTLVNDAGCNEGSCKIFAFAGLHALTQQQTLALFGKYYQEVLSNPAGDDHKNIRNFMRDGWNGIVFRGQALQAL